MAAIALTEGAAKAATLEDEVVDPTATGRGSGESVGEPPFAAQTDSAVTKTHEEEVALQQAATLERQRNPAAWPIHLFTEKKDRSTKKSKGHSLPTGMHVAPLNDSGQRIIGEYEWLYSRPGEHIATGNPGRTLVEEGEGTMRGDGPDGSPQRKSHLRPEMYGSTTVSQAMDPLYFLFKRLPITDFWITFTSKSNAYAGQDLGLGSALGTPFEPLCFEEMIRSYGWKLVASQVGYLGKETMTCRFDKQHPGYSKELAEGSLTKARLYQINRVAHCCDNGSPFADKDSPLFSITHKVDWMLKWIPESTHRLCILNPLGQDLVIDEQTVFTDSHGPCLGTIRGKKNDHGFQTVVTMDAFLHRIWTLEVRHTRHERPAFSTGLDNYSGPLEFLRAKQYLAKLDPATKKTVLSDACHYTVDNYFDSEKLGRMISRTADQLQPGEDLDQSGYTSTTRKDRLPPGAKQCFHTVDVPSKKASRKEELQALNPVVATIPGSANAYVTMMSTQGTTWHIVGPTARAVWVYTRDRKKGLLIKLDYMNPVRELYLLTYGKIDNFDALLVRILMVWGNRKRYYSSLFVYTFQCIIIMSWQDHCQFIEEHAQVDEWKAMKPLKFAQFAITLGRSMLNYDPSAMLYDGEELLTANLRAGHKRKAASAAAQARKVPGGPANNRIVSPAHAVRYPVYAADLLPHMRGCEVPGGGRKACHNCGRRCQLWDPICKVSLHHSCFAAYHDSSRRGLAWADTRCKGH